MSEGSLKSWLEAYGHAWETRSPEAVGEIFTDGATYQETPYEEPVQGRSAIMEYWSQAVTSQNDIHFKYEIIASTIEVGVAHWSASFNRIKSNTRTELDGIFLLTFDERNRCSSLREWWFRRSSQ